MGKALAALAAGAAGAGLLAAWLWRRAGDDDDDDETAARHVYRIVLTGGPCAGKTTALARLSGFLQERGFRVYTVPEMATLLFTNGVAFGDLDRDEAVLAMQRTVLGGQTTLEDGFARVAATTRRPAVLLCDRGALDGSAYMDRALWGRLIAPFGGLDAAERRLCERYDAVLHLVTAAAGAERYYTLENNAARTEAPAQAVAQDEATQRAWAPHPRLMVFDNSGADGFEGKLRRVVESCAKVVGLPVLPKGTRKFVLAAPPPGPDVFEKHGVQVTSFEATKTFLRAAPRRRSGSDTLAHALPPDEPPSFRHHAYVRLRRSPEGVLSYGYAEVVQDEQSGELHERKRRLARREYEIHLAAADRKRTPVHQRRLHFLYKNQSFVVHQYLKRDLAILHCQAARPDGIDLPPFLSVGSEIAEADRAAYSAYEISAQPDRPSSPRTLFSSAEAMRRSASS